MAPNLGWTHAQMEGIGLIILPLAVVVFVITRAVKRRMRLSGIEPRCLHCGYDLTANESGRCPECGVERAVLEAAMIFDIDRANRRHSWGWIIVGTIMLIGPEFPGVTLAVCTICGAIWARNLPRFPLGQCQVCGMSLSGTVDRRCGKCGVRANSESESLIRACAAIHRRRLQAGTLTLLIVGCAVLWTVSATQWFRFEFNNQLFTAQSGRIVYTTPAHEEQWLTVEFLHGDLPAEPSRTNRLGLIWPNTYERYRAWNYEVPMWVVMSGLVAVMPAIWLANRRTEPLDRSALRMFVRFPLTLIRARAAIRGFLILVGAMAASLIVRWANIPSLS